MALCAHLSVFPGATLSQLSDSGQTLSEDSGVDIAEAGGLSKDSSPRPGKPPFRQVTGDTRRAEGHAQASAKQVRQFCCLNVSCLLLKVGFDVYIWR